MTKQFKLFTGNNYGVQSVDGEVFIDSIVSIGDADVLVDLLNDLKQEIEQLKKDNMLLIEDSEKYRKLSIQFDNRNKELISENEQLKSEKKDMQILINTISDQRNEFHRGVRENANRVGKLEKENEQLKKEKDYYKRELQKELVCQAIIDRREKND